MWSLFRYSLILLAAFAGIPLLRYVDGGQFPLAATGDQELIHRTPSDLAKLKVFANGVVEGSSPNVPLKFEICGRLQSVHFQVGEYVKQGSVLAELDADALKIALEKAVADLEQAKANHKLLVAGAREETIQAVRLAARVAYEEMMGAKALLDRTSKLTRDGIVTGQELDDRKSNYARTHAHYKALLAKVEETEADTRPEEIGISEVKIQLAEIQVRQAEHALSKTKLLAPSNGVVLHRQGEVGELVDPQTSPPVFIVVDDQVKRVRAYVEELFAAQVHEGDAATVTSEGTGEARIPGKIIRCAPYMDEKKEFSNRPSERVDVRVREILIQLDPGTLADQLVVGMPVDVSVD